MNKLALGLILAALAAPAAAQAPPAARPPTPAGPPREATNQQLGVDADRYIGDPSRNPTRISRDAIMTQVILNAGDPSAPGPDGAVLRYRKEAALAWLQPGESTNLGRQAEQQIIYVKSGQGRLDDGAKYWDLSEGMIALIPADQVNRLASTGDTPLTMITLTGGFWPGRVAPVSGILVRDTRKVLYIEQGVHWNNLSKSPFADVGERMLIVYLGPMSIAAPHTHTPETEEGWVKITDASALIQIGSELRPWPGNVGFLSPNNNQTVHAAINTSDEVQSWFYFQGRAAAPPQPPAPPPGAAPAPGPNAGGRPGNSEIIASSAAATVAGRPLSALRGAPDLTRK